MSESKATIHLRKREQLKNKYNLSDLEYDYLWKLFMEYGMTSGEAPHRSPANHYYLQGISEHNVIEWHTWKSKMTSELKKIISEKYPQLMVTDKTLQ
ncbi:hypothetical protein [Elizabethkingia meningoseptica]|uniref:hypothetical protein n=1 Tax=Elizabethkingia meningoseptica TaxID=238 RepID=UPI0011163DA8|nr:hypothetical protein [Elizabethkingia meningoseptica]